MAYPPAEIAQQRAEFLAELQSRILDDYNESRAGTLETVLCEGWSPEMERYFGRSYAESPDIDGHIWFTAARPVEHGEFVTVRLEGAEDGEPRGRLEEEDDR